MLLSGGKEQSVLICCHTMDVSITFKRGSLCKSHTSDCCPRGGGCLAMGGIACHNTEVINTILDFIFSPIVFHATSFTVYTRTHCKQTNAQNVLFRDIWTFDFSCNTFFLPNQLQL